MAALGAQQINQLGLVPTLVAATTSGDTFSPGDDTVLMVKNGASSSITVTVATVATAYGEPIANVSVTIAAGATAFIGPFPVGEVAQPGGQANITYSSATTVTIAVLTF